MFREHFSNRSGALCVLSAVGVLTAQSLFLSGPSGFAAEPVDRKEQLAIPAMTVNKSLPLDVENGGKKQTSIAATANSASSNSPKSGASGTAASGGATANSLGSSANSGGAAASSGGSTAPPTTTPRAGANSASPASPAGQATAADGMEYTIHGKPASKEQYQAAMLVDEGILLLRSNANEQALQKIKQALAMYDELAEGHHALGVVYTKLKKFDDAQKALKRSLELSPDSENTWIMLAGSYQAANDLPHTILTYHQFLAKFPKSAHAPKINQNMAILYAQLGFNYARQGKSDEAINELKDAIKLNPTLDSPLLTLASVYQATGRIDEAIGVYEEFNVKFKGHAMSAQVKGLLEALKKEKNRLRKNAQNELAVSTPKMSDTVGGGGAGAAPAGGESGGEQSDPPSDSPDATKPPKPEARDDYLSFMVQNENGLNRWPKTRIPITVYVSDGAKVPGYRESFKTILKQSFEDWAKASNGGVAFQFVENPKSALLQVFWTDKISDLKNAAEAGDARLFMDQSYISRAEVWFLTKPVVAPLNDNYFRLISLHEIGHSLGLSGHTTNPDDIMFYSATFKDAWRELSGRDSRSITRLYQNDL